MGANKEAGKSIGEESGWCEHCRFAALCLTQGHKTFVQSFRPEIIVTGCAFESQKVLDDLVSSILYRIEGIVCQLGLPARVTYVCEPRALTAQNEGELRAYIRGFAKGVSETVRSVLLVENEKVRKV